jgi:cyclophilin family peptidyl-prolyl cis-trans isomerase
MKASFLAGAVGLGLVAGSPAYAQHRGDAGRATPPAPPPTSPPEERQVPDGDMTGMAGHEGMAGGMTGALGSYPLTREASGTAWQPDASAHGGVHLPGGDWMLMGHALLNLVYDRQEGPRGGEKAFVSGMLMGMAQRSFANGNTLQFRIMLSPEPPMGRSGYPLLLASGETANGVDPLIDRQHPHDLFMELSASYSVKLSGKASIFLYGGLPGEPAFGPPAFMHRQSIMDSPEAPIAHHWLDSTHITFGVVTAGLVLDRFKIEASRFHGGEPDQHRYDIETGPLDSTSVRVSANPTPTLSLQASWAHLESPEQLEPGVDQRRWSASAIYTRRFGGDGWWATTLAWGRRSSEGESFDAATLESAVGLRDWTLFGRAEYIENPELLFVGGHHGPAFKVGKVSVGAIRDFRVGEHAKLGAGALFALNFVPSGLEALYGGDPKGAMAFVRLKIE